MPLKPLLLSIVALSTYIHNAHAVADSLGFRPPIYGNGGGVREFLRDAIGLLPTPDSLVAVDGKVFVGFTVDEQGKVRDVRVLRGLHPMYDSIAVAGVRAAAARTKWQPQIRNGQPERSSLSVPIAFRVEAEEPTAPPPFSLSTEVYLRPDRMPVYGSDGSIREFTSDVQQMLQCPDRDSMNAAGINRGGFVVMNMVVNERGEIETIGTEDNNVHPLLKNAAIDAVRAVKTKWKPGWHQGKNVSTKLVFTVSFRDCVEFDVEPSFAGKKGFAASQAEFRKQVENTMIYPPQAEKNRITGNVYVSIKINEQGELAEIKVQRGAHPLLDQEAVRAAKVVLRRKKWKPGVINQKPVAFTFTIPIFFRLR